MPAPRRFRLAAGLGSLSLWRDRQGAVALAFGISLIPLCLLIGLAIDFAFIAQARAQLDLAADTAALTATKTAGAAFSANVGSTAAVTLGQNDGVAWFNAQVGLIPNASIVGAPHVVVTPSGNNFSSVVTYLAHVNTFFAGLFGVSYVSLTNAADATITANAFVNVTFLLDNSSSMLIAATLADITTMESLSAAASASGAVTLPSSDSGFKGTGCAFACHWDSAGKDYYQVARTAGVQLRFNVVQSALATAIGLMASTEANNGLPQTAAQPQFGTTVYTFNSCAPNCITQIYPTSGSPGAAGYNLTGTNGAQAQASAIATPLTCNTCSIGNTGDTAFPQAMAALVAQSSAAGDGSSAANPRKALIIVTDGLQDWSSNACPSGNTYRTPVPNYSQVAGSAANSPCGAEGPINSADCSAMKALGYDVYVLYTTYFTADAGGNTAPLVPFNEFLIPYVAGTGTPASYDLTPNMKACASAPANYAEASSPSDITAAMSAMLQAAINSGARLTY